jgi:carbamoyl-phosphate synthase large subunit
LNLYFGNTYGKIVEHEKPEGVIVQLGGQTALKLARRLHEKGIKIIGTSFDNMDIAEDRGRFSDMLKELGIPYPNYGTAYNTDEAIEVCKNGWLPGINKTKLCIRRTKNANCFE